MSFTHYPFSSEWSGWERRQHIQKPLVVILLIQNSGTLAKITLNRISSWEAGWTSKRVNGNRRQWYAIKASSWNQTENVAVTCFLPTQTPTALAFEKGSTMLLWGWSGGAGVGASVIHRVLTFYNLNWSLLTVFKGWLAQITHSPKKQEQQKKNKHTQKNIFSVDNFVFLVPVFWNIPLPAVNSFHWNYFQSLSVSQSREDTVSGETCFFWGFQI